MTVTAVRLFPDTYVDSVIALRSMRAMRESDAVNWATAVMGTPANVEALQQEGVSVESLSGAAAGDFCLAVRADDDPAAQQALELGANAAFAAQKTAGGTAVQNPRTIRRAVAEQPDSNVAIVSVPGQFAAVPAYQALSAGMHVLLFSDNVSLEDEIALKNYARSKDLLVMGPGAGTSMIGGVGLGFANVVSPGRVGVVAAAGTGAQEAMTLLDRWGVGVSQVIGVGGRDVGLDVGGTMAIAGVETLRDDPDTAAILLVSKPPSPEVAHRVIEAAGSKPLIAALIGLDSSHFSVPATATLKGTLESGVAEALAVLGHPVPDVTTLAGPSLAEAHSRLSAGRSAVRGLFSGGTLCYESQVILNQVLGPVYSNAPVDHRLELPGPAGSHQCLDLGEEEYTRGRPHPMIDAEARVDVIREHAADPSVAVIVLDVVLGYGSHPDPAGVLAPVAAEVMANGGPQIVAYVLGTDQDPQNWTSQRAKLVNAGCIVTETAARASLAAAAIATGHLDIAGKSLP